MTSHGPQLHTTLLLPAWEGGCSQAHGCARQRQGRSAAEWEEQCVMRRQRPVKKEEKDEKEYELAPGAVEHRRPTKANFKWLELLHLRDELAS